MSEPVVQETWRIGIIREFSPQKGIGRLADVETGKEIRFSREAVQDKGWSPGKGQRVNFVVRSQDERETILKLKRV